MGVKSHFHVFGKIRQSPNWGHAGLRYDRPMLQPTRAHYLKERIIHKAADRGDLTLAVRLADAWDERIAICTIDGQLTEDQAEKVALAELGEILARSEASA